MDAFMAYMDELDREFVRQEQVHLEEHCKDEANFAKIKSNVCGICRTLYQVACKKTTEEEKRSEYLRLTGKLMTEWENSYTRAKEHDDVKKLVVEEAKLSVIRDIRNRFEQ